MGSVCATNSVTDDATNYEQIKSGALSKEKKDKQGFKLVHQTSTSVSTIDDARQYRRIRHTYKNYRIGITRSYIFEMQKLLYNSHTNAENTSYYQIPSRISSLILSFLPTYFFEIYGIGKNLISSSEISEFERLHIFEPKLSCLNNIYCGHDKYFIKSYISEIYGIGNNLFDGLCLNVNNNENPDDNNYNIKHITSFYKYFDFVDLNSPIELISNSIYSNDITIKLRNGSIYTSSLTMSDIGEWKRKFKKPVFDSHMDDITINKHLNIMSISCGLLHTLFLTDNGNVYSSGNNNNGQCGLGYLSKQENKLKIINQFIEENIQIKQITCGKYHSACIDNNGNLWCCGLNDNNQCSETEISIIINKPIKIYYNIDTIIKVGCGESFTVYLTQKGYYYGFGKIIVSTLDKVNITKWDANNDIIFKDLSCGANHILLIGMDNQIYSHGSNQYFKSGLKVGRANKPTKVKNDKLPKLPQIPCAVIAGINNSIVIFNA